MVVVTQIPYFQPDEKAADREIWFELREVAAGRSDGRGLPLVIKDRLCAHLRRDYILFPWYTPPPFCEEVLYTSPS